MTFREGSDLAFVKAVDIAFRMEQASRDAGECTAGLAALVFNKDKGKRHARHAKNRQVADTLKLKGHSSPSALSMRSRWQHSDRDTYSSPPQAPSSSACSYCGGQYHRRENCPAWCQTCRCCGKQGHFAKVCRASRDNKRHHCHKKDRREPRFPPKQCALVRGAPNDYFD